MIQKLRGVYKNSTIAVVGSSPTAQLYKGDCDISIAVNGAALLGPRFNYFLCGDWKAPLRDWWTVDTADVRVIATLVSLMDYQLYPEDKFPGLERNAVPAHEAKKVSKQPPPIHPHLTFRYRSHKRGILNDKNNFLMYRGTVSCCAAQLAFIMGCKHIKLYGCEFSGAKSNHYFYEANHIGSVRKTMIQVMDSVLGEIRNKGVRVTVYGKTNLTQFDQQL